MIASFGGNDFFKLFLYGKGDFTCRNLCTSGRFLRSRELFRMIINARLGPFRRVISNKANNGR